MSASLNTTALFPIFSPLLNNALPLFDTKLWYPSPNRHISSRPWFLPLSFIAFTCSLMLPRSLRLTIATPALLLLTSQTRVVSSGKVATDFSIAAMMFGYALKWIDFGMLVKEGELFRVEDPHPRGTEQRALKERDRGVWQRLKDALYLLVFNSRGIGWNWRVGGIPERPPQSKATFLLGCLQRFAFSFVLIDAVKYISALIPYIHQYPRPSFFHQSFAIQVLLTWLHQLEAFAFFSLPYELISFACVAANFHQPAEWPPLFGSLSDAYLVSRAWGRTWHQLLRRPLGLLTPHAQAFLGVKSRGSKRTVSLLCSFLMSGLAHWVGAANRPWSETAWGMFWYFMMQAPVIRVEDLVVEWGEKRGWKGSRGLRYLGYVWTFGWFSFSMRYAAAYQFESGPLSKFKPMGFSLSRYVLGKMSQ